MKKGEEAEIEHNFLSIFGKSTKMKVLNFLFEKQNNDHSLTELSKNTKVSYPIVVKIVEDFLKIGLIKHTRKIGKAKLFKLNLKNKIIKHLLPLHEKLDEFIEEVEEIEEEREEEKIPSYI